MIFNLQGRPLLKLMRKLLLRVLEIGLRQTNQRRTSGKMSSRTDNTQITLRSYCNNLVDRHANDVHLFHIRSLENILTTGNPTTMINRILIHLSKFTEALITLKLLVESSRNAECKNNKVDIKNWCLYLADTPKNTTVSEREDALKRPADITTSFNIIKRNKKLDVFFRLTCSKEAIRLLNNKIHIRELELQVKFATKPK